jgi:hypothetical protein
MDMSTQRLIEFEAGGLKEQQEITGREFRGDRKKASPTGDGCARRQNSSEP